MPENVIKIGLFNRDAAIIAAEGKGFLKQENLRVEINTVTDSPTLLRNLIRGQYDLILNNADNVIAWAKAKTRRKMISSSSWAAARALIKNS
jgi:ABC-type nitrate/sulfonate/bicarbonate transport system substrate-binding protein